MRLNLSQEVMRAFTVNSSTKLAPHHAGEKPGLAGQVYGTIQRLHPLDQCCLNFELQGLTVKMGIWNNLEKDTIRPKTLKQSRGSTGF